MKLNSPRTWLLVLLVVVLGIAVYMSDRSALWRGDLTSSVTPTIVRKNGFDIHLITLDEPTDVATLTASTVYLVTVKPPFGSFGQPLDRLFHEPSVSYYGYMYTQNKAGELEGQESTDFLEQFPGVFFASNAARIYDDAGDQILSAFEVAHSVVLQGTDTPETDVAIGDRTYLLVVMNGVATLQKPVALLTCGNGAVDPGEQCDDGNVVDIDECSNECRTAICGDGICQASEGTQCNEEVGACTGNFVCVQDCTDMFSSSSSSSDACTQEECGPAPDLPNTTCPDAVFAGPVCRRNTSGVCGWDILECPSSSSSSAGSCGNGTVDPGEECDDGNTLSTDSCNAQCFIVPCQCPEGVTCTCVDPGSSSSSSVASSSANLCGNSIVDAGEQCDDGNATLWDGCSAQCEIQTCDMCPPNADCNCTLPSSSSSSVSSSADGSCGDGVCQDYESAIACTPPVEDPDVCDGQIFCPQDCGEGQPQL